ncbi:hypothetical protein ACFIQF_23330 [Comamonas sp. J-3]|uniref:hypothetical protein n=1 Tax=Comamonas trifloxystrobinivorans TaxID=3350256 RepID=UPI00372BD678
MSKMKSKFGKKPKTVSPPAGPQVWCVDVYECEEGWGDRFEGTSEFPSEEAAEKFAQEINARRSQDGNDDCFAVAHRPYSRNKVVPKNT